MTKNLQPSLNKTPKPITDTEVSIIFNEIMQNNRLFNSEAIGEKGLKPWSSLRWGDKKIINEILNSNPDLNSLKVNWFWVKHDYIKLISVVLNIKKSCDLPNKNLTDDKIENAINCIKNDHKLGILKIKFDELSSKDKKDFFSEILKIAQKIEEFSNQHNFSMEEICKEAYIKANDKENFRCNIAEGEYIDIFSNLQSPTTRKLLSIDEENVFSSEIDTNQHLLSLSNNDDEEINFNNGSYLSSNTLLGLLFFPLPILLLFGICAGYHYYCSSTEEDKDLATSLIGEENHTHNE